MEGNPRMARPKPKTRSQREARRKRMAASVGRGKTPQQVADAYEVSLTQVKNACRQFDVKFKDRRFNENK